MRSILTWPLVGALIRQQLPQLEAFVSRVRPGCCSTAKHRACASDVECDATSLRARLFSSFPQKVGEEGPTERWAAREGGGFWQMSAGDSWGRYHVWSGRGRKRSQPFAPATRGGRGRFYQHTPIPQRKTPTLFFGHLLRCCFAHYATVPQTTPMVTLRNWNLFR